jgi:hypothetical protein
MDVAWCLGWAGKNSRVRKESAGEHPRNSFERYLEFNLLLHYLKHEERRRVVAVRNEVPKRVRERKG